MLSKSGARLVPLGHGRQGKFSPVGEGRGHVSWAVARLCLVRHGRHGEVKFGVLSHGKVVREMARYGRRGGVS